MPEPHEVSAAEILAAHFQTQVTFLKRSLDYRQTSPDILMLGIKWEMKSPKSQKMGKVAENLREALGQSSSVILDTRRTIVDDGRILGFISRKMTNRKKLQRLLVITKHQEVLALWGLREKEL